MNALSLCRRRLADAQDLLAEVGTSTPAPAGAANIAEAGRLVKAAVAAVDRARNGLPQMEMSPEAASPYALIAGDSGPVTATLVVVVFHTPAEADTFARQHGFGDWSVAPIRFALDATPQQPINARAAPAER